MNEITQTKVGLQKSTKKVIPFVPTKAMMKWFDTSIKLGHTASISDVAKKSKLDRKNWYIWMDKLGFVEWWDQQWQKFFAANRWKLNAIGMKQAEQNYSYWRDMMIASGNLSEGFSEEATFVWRKK